MNEQLLLKQIPTRFLQKHSYMVINIIPGPMDIKTWSRNLTLEQNWRSSRVSKFLNTYLESPQCCQIHHFVDVYPNKQLMLIVITPNFFCQVSYQSFHRKSLQICKYGELLSRNGNGLKKNNLI